MNENEPHISASCTPDGEVKFEIIPRDKEIEERQKSQIQKVGPYCRVSTLSEQQETSYEQQRLHYTEYVERHPGWELVDIYADLNEAPKGVQPAHCGLQERRCHLHYYQAGFPLRKKYGGLRADLPRAEEARPARGGIFRDRGAEYAVPEQ